MLTRLMYIYIYVCIYIYIHIFLMYVLMKDYLEEVNFKIIQIFIW